MATWYRVITASGSPHGLAAIVSMSDGSSPTATFPVSSRMRPRSCPWIGVSGVRGVPGGMTRAVRGTGTVTPAGRKTSTSRAAAVMCERHTVASTSSGGAGDWSDGRGTAPAWRRNDLVAETYWRTVSGESPVGLSLIASISVWARSPGGLPVTQSA